MTICCDFLIRFNNSKPANQPQQPPNKRSVDEVLWLSLSRSELMVKTIISKSNTPASVSTVFDGGSFTVVSGSLISVTQAGVVYADSTRRA